MLASSDAMGRNQGSYLGQVWAVLNPLLQFAVFWVVFGVALNLSKGTSDFLSFLAIGVFLYGFMSSCLHSCATSIRSRLGLVRALDFPRAVLPISVVMTEIVMMWPALLVMFLVLILRGQPITWEWLLFPVVLVCMYSFILGAGFMLARICEATPDYANLVGVATQLLRYMSGVFFNIAQYAKNHELIAWLLEHQPLGLYLKLARCVLITPDPKNPGEYAHYPYEWAMAVGWAAVFLGLGFVFFWRAEARYGRD